MDSMSMRILFLAGAVVVAGCKEEGGSGGSGATGDPGTSTAPMTAPTASPTGAAGHSDARVDHPNAVVLGEATVAGLHLKAMQDEPVKPGSDGAFDIYITGGKPRAVRFWVGVESGEGSVKARAEEETTDNWHIHVEIPDPLPPGSKFWAEIEPPQGEKQTVGFELKR